MTERHGTITGYTNDKCTCDECRGAMAAYQRGRRSRLFAELKHSGLPSGKSHGTLDVYANYRCRCEACSGAQKSYDAIRRAK